MTGNIIRPVQPRHGPARRPDRPGLSAIPGSGTPRDWVDGWPDRLIRNGQVSYAVYYTTVADDPPEENQVVETSAQHQFRLLIERYGGQLVHTVYYHHEGRAWVYRLTARLAHPVLSYAVRGSALTLHGAGLHRERPGGSGL